MSLFLGIGRVSSRLKNYTRVLRATSPHATASRDAPILAAVEARFTTMRTPAGPGLVAWTSGGVIALEAFVTGGPPGAAGRIRFLETVMALAGEPAVAAPLPARLRARIRVALAGQTTAAPVDLSVFEPLRREVYRSVMTIPRASVASYADVARDIGKPRAWRAVGSALRRCPIDFLIPCHRVVHSGGRIDGPTTASIEWKRAMLRREGVTLD